jgi:hypothetical protein
MKNLILLSVLFLTLLLTANNSRAMTQTNSDKPDSTDMGWTQLADDLEVFLSRLEFQDGAYEKWQAIPNTRQLVAIDAWAAFAVPYMEGYVPVMEDDQAREDAAAYIGWLQGDKNLGANWVALSQERKNAMYTARNKPEIEALKILITRLRSN